VNAGWTPGERL